MNESIAISSSESQLASMPAVTLLQTNRIAYSLGSRLLFSGLTMRCNGGELVGLIGPSGCGKTTLLGILGQLIKPSSGETVIQGHSTANWRGRQRLKFWKDQASFIYQDYGLIDEENVGFNISLVRRLGRKRRYGAGTARLNGVLATVGLAGRVDEPAAVLSGGEKQRLGIARAIWKNAALVFADEPTASLDDANKAIVIQLFEDLARRGACVICATHDDELMEHCSQLIDVSQYAAVDGAV
ncbi:MAG: ATP-binding cassette domain-containing protein [Bifidobacteriaceae bacterium]|jgi:putative ABC transport system ATP-binding protein|nr:ATP-binding cassette domain-containing protein [Bifidobacteriaceae bacterium]